MVSLLIDVGRHAFQFIVFTPNVHTHIIVDIIQANGFLFGRVSNLKFLSVKLAINNF